MLVELRKKRRKIYLNGVYVKQIKHNGYYYTISDQYYNPNDVKQKNHRYYNPKEYIGETIEDCLNIFIYYILPTIVEDLLKHVYKYTWSSLSSYSYYDFKMILREYKMVLDLLKDYSPKIIDVIEKFKVKHPEWHKSKKFDYKIPFSVIIDNLITCGFITVTDGNGKLTEKGLLSYSNNKPNIPKHKIISTQVLRSAEKKCLSCGKKIEWHQTYCFSCKNKQTGQSY